MAVGASKYGNTNLDALEVITSLDEDAKIRVKVPGSSAYKAITKSNLQKDITLTTPGADHTAIGPRTDAFNAGATIAAITLVYMGSDGKWLVADASAAATSRGLLAISLEAKEDTEAMDVALSGSMVRDESWDWTPGDVLYVSETAGEITDTAPSGTTDAVVRPVGFAVSANVIFFNPSALVTLQ